MAKRSSLFDLLINYSCRELNDISLGYWSETWNIRFGYISICLPVWQSLMLFVSECHHLSIRLFVGLSIFPPICLFLLCLPVRLSFCLADCPSVCLSIHPSVCPRVCPSLQLFVCLSTYIYVYLCICLSMSMFIYFNVSLCLSMSISLFFLRRFLYPVPRRRLDSNPWP
jgi:hypothetical protein